MSRLCWLARLIAEAVLAFAYCLLACACLLNAGAVLYHGACLLLHRG